MVKLSERLTNQSPFVQTIREEGVKGELGVSEDDGTSDREVPLARARWMLTSSNSREAETWLESGCKDCNVCTTNVVTTAENRPALNKCSQLVKRVFLQETYKN